MNDVPGKLYGRKTPPGMEVKILRKMPLVFVASTLITASLSVVVRMFSGRATGFEAAKHIASVDIFVIATVVTLWTALLTVTIGAVLVQIMKGPAYVADAYPLDSQGSPTRVDSGISRADADQQRAKK